MQRNRAPSEKDIENGPLSTPESPPDAEAIQGSVGVFAPDGALRPFRLLKSELDWKTGRLKYYINDWSIFNQLVLASAVFVFFTNLLPGITFASDLYQLTGRHYGAIEVIFSTGLCGLIFSM